MLVSLTKDSPESELGETLVHVEVSDIDGPLTYSHSFKYKVPSGIDEKGKPVGKIIIYTDKNAVSGVTSFSFDLEKCHNKDCKKEVCPVTESDRLLVADVFHTKPKTQALQEFGSALYKALFSGCAEKLLRETEPSGRIYLQLNKHLDLDAIPWEYAKIGAVFLVHQHIFARVHCRPQNPLSKLPLRIVTVVPDPVIPPNEPGADLADLHLSEQFRSFIDGFAKNKKAVKLERVFPPTLGQMDAQLLNEPETATVLHFMGHCGQKNGSRGLIFEHNDNGRQEHIDASRLVNMPKHLQLAFLSACDTREVARALVERSVPFTIGSNCLIPNDLARRFESEFYKFLSVGSTVEMAMCQARASLQDPDKIRHSYFAGAMVFYSSRLGEDGDVFECKDGEVKINYQEPPHNLTVLHTIPILGGCKTELDKLYNDLRQMVDRGTRFAHVYTIKGLGGQEFVAEAMRRMAHLFPGGIFAWAFDREETSVIDYFRFLVEVLFSKDVWKQLMEQHDGNVEELGRAIIQKFRTHSTCLLILNRADILDLGRKSKIGHAEKLGSWLEDVKSVDAVKIILTSEEPLDWLNGELMDLRDLNINSRDQGYTTKNPKTNIHEYFQYSNERVDHLEGFKTCFYGVPGENCTFTDRSIIQEMKAALSSGSDRTLALSGLGGMGKTQLMLRYCYLHQKTYDYIFWLSVESWNEAVYSYRKLADYLGLDEKILKEKDSEQKVTRWVLDWFQERTKWLLLLDNADEETSNKLSEILPSKGGHIIFTTRMPISAEKAKVIHVDKMQKQEAILLLYGVSSIDLVDQKSAEFNYAQEIVIELDCMPLAIKRAQAYVESTSTTFKQFLISFRDQKKCIHFFNAKDSGPYEHSVSTVWNLSLEQIKARNPTAIRILHACAFLQPEGIPVCFFERQWSVLELIPNEQENEEMSDSIRKAIAILAEFSFVKRTRQEDEEDEENSASDLLMIHRLVQKVIYDTMDGEQRLHWAHNIVTALNADVQYDRFAPRTRRTMGLHISHFVRLLGDISQIPLLSKDLCSLLNRKIQYLLSYGTCSDIHELVQFSIRLSGEVYGEEHHQFATSLNNHAELYRRQGKYIKAESLHKRALSIREMVLGSAHPDTAQSLNNLAILYSNRGKYEKAGSLYERALAICEKELGSEHPDTAQSLNNLADLYTIWKRYNEAESLCKRALAIREMVLGPEHPDTAYSLSSLAVVYLNQGRYDEAESLHSRVLEIRKKTLGLEHPATAKSLTNLAILYKTRDKDKAEQLYKDALAIRKKALGLEHPDTVRSINSLAVLYFDQGKYEEAEQLYQEALAIRKKALGLKHPDTASSQINLAILYSKRGECEKAEQLYEQALAILKASESEHPDTAYSMSSLAVVFFNQNRYDDAESLHNRALVIREKTLGLEHPTTVQSLINLAILYKTRDKDKAEQLYKRVLEIRKKTLGLYHPDTAQSINSLAVFYFDQGKYGEAEPLYKQALAFRGKALGSEHRDFVASVVNLALLYKQWKRYDEAERLFQMALDTCEKVSGSKHPDTVKSLLHLVMLYDSSGEYDKAKQLCQQALAIRKEALGSEHTDTMQVSNILKELNRKKVDKSRKGSKWIPGN